MTGIDIKIDEDVVQAAVASAILDRLGADGQRELITAALKYLTTAPPSNSYTRNPASPLQSAFNTAVGGAATRIVNELVANNEEFQEKIKAQIGEAFVLMESTNYTDYLGSAIGEALRQSRRSD